MPVLDPKFKVPPFEPDPNDVPLVGDLTNEPVKNALRTLSSGGRTSGRPQRKQTGSDLFRGVLNRGHRVEQDNNWGNSRVYQQQVYWLEFRHNGKLIDISKDIATGSLDSPGQRIALPNVQNVQATANQPSVVTYSIGVVAHVERSPLRDHVVTLSGVTGADMVFDPVSNTYTDPVEYFDKIKDGLEILSNRPAPTPTSGKNPMEGQRPDGYRLVLRSSFERFNHMCEPVTFAFRRSPQNKFSVQWTLTLRLYSRFRPSLEETTLHVDKSLFLSGCLPLFQYSRNIVNAARLAAKYTIPGRVQQAAFTALNSTVGMFNILDSMSWDAGTESMSARMWFDAANFALNRFDTFFYDTLSWEEQSEWKSGEEQNTGAADAHRFGLVGLMVSSCMSILGSDEPSAFKIYPEPLGQNELMPFPDGSVLDASTRRQPLWRGPTKNIVVKQGDTLELIALREMGTPDAWLTIASINDMKTPNTFSDGSPLVAGDIIIVPNPAAIQSDLFDQENPFGVDLLIGADGDLQLLNDDATDVKLAYNSEALKQGLSHRLRIKKGDSVIFPEMGLAIGPGDPSTFLRVTDAVASVIDQMESDPRIATCVVHSAIDGGDRIIVNSRVVSKDGLQASISAPVGY